MPSITGLTAAEVNARRAAGQTNTPPKSQTKTTGEIVRDNICTYFNLVFLVLAVMLALVRSWLNMGFLGIVFCNTLIGIVQQLRAKRTIDKLTLVSAQKIRCLRDGRWCEVLSDDLVQDDVVEFGAGDQIAADAVVLDDTNLDHPQDLPVRARLERMTYLADERNIAAKYVEGRKIL